MKIEELKIYQKEIIQFLNNAKNNNKLVQAYLFEGINGSGTYEMAQYFAMMLLCSESEPCLKCNTCERIMYNSHISVITIEPIDGLIRKEQIEYLMKDESQSALEGTYLIYIIKDADKMNTSSSNALLKILEEPFENHYFVLTTQNKNSILDTIVSRCQCIQFNAPTASYVEKELISKGINLEEAFLISNYIQDPSIAEEYADNPKYFDIYKLSEKVVISSLSTGGSKDPYVEYFLGKEHLESLDDHKFFLSCLILIYKELIKVKNNNSKYFENIVKSIKLNRISIEKLLKYLDILFDYQNRIDYNVNLNLFYSGLFSKMLEEK